MNTHITENSVFDDLNFDETEASNLKIRAALMMAIEQELSKQKLTQTKAAELLGVSQPRISDLIQGKIHLFTIDMLVNLLNKLGRSVSFSIEERLAA